MLAPSFEGLFHLFAVGLSIIAYLVLVSPSNIYAALERIPFGGRSIGFTIFVGEIAAPDPIGLLDLLVHGQRFYRRSTERRF